MKILVRILLVVSIIVVLIFTGAFIFVRSNAKQVISQRLSLALNRPVSIGTMQVLFPLGLRLTDFNVEGYGHIDEVYAGFGVFYLFNNSLNFSNLVLTRPRAVIRRTKDAGIIFGDVPKTDGSGTEGENAPPATANGNVSPAPSKGNKRQASFNFSVDRLMIKNGSVDFIDTSSDGIPFQLALRNINLRLRNAAFPLRSLRTRFDCTVSVAESNVSSSMGKIEGHGWADLARKDMKGRFIVADLDGKVFAPYYGESINRDFKSIRADLSVDLESKNNDMAVHGKLVVKDFILNVQKDEDPKSLSVESLILGGLQSVAKEVAVDFSFKTKMDNFKLESVSFSGSVLSEASGGTHKDSTRAKGSLVK